MSITIPNTELSVNLISPFIKNGFILEEKNPNKKYCNVFEVGFGTGLNAFLTYNESKFILDTKLIYTSVEPYPLKLSEIHKLNYSKKLDDNDKIFNFIHQSKWKFSVQLSKNFTLTKNITTLQNFNIEINQDIIYFDPFCYRVQPNVVQKNNKSNSQFNE